MADNIIDYKVIVESIKKNTKASFLARYDDNDKLIPNLANLGGMPGDFIKREGDGEYHGIVVEILEETRPLLTDRFVIKILSMVEKQDYVTPLELLRLTSISQLNYILDKWLSHSQTQYFDDFASEDIKYPQFDQWITTVASSPVLSKIRIIEVGQNTKTHANVFPLEWIGRIFQSGQDLHNEMDKLPSRIGQPPVTYAVCNFMIVQKLETIIKITPKTKYKYIIYLRVVKGRITKAEFSKVVDKSYEFVKYNDVLIGFRTNEILSPKTTSEKNSTVGVLVSRLQKAIRRGKYGSRVLIDTILKLNNSPNYNMPEHSFMRVSSARQLVWRLFVSIIEDCRPYTVPDIQSGILGMLELATLVLITQRLMEYKFNDNILNQILYTSVLVQFNDSSRDIYNWRKYSMAVSTPIVPTNSFQTALSLMLENSIMMNADTVMMRKYYSAKFKLDALNQPTEYEFDIDLMPNISHVYNDDVVADEIICASYDMHCKPNIILYYQACIPISMTTRQISSFIWDTSSSYNTRLGIKKPIVDANLLKIQRYFRSVCESDVSVECDNRKKISTEKFTTRCQTNKIQPDDVVKRLSFLSLFGTKYKFNKRELIIGGTVDLPIRVKTADGWINAYSRKYLNAFPKREIDLKKIECPFNYKWNRSKCTIQIRGGIPYIDDVAVEFFDASILLESNLPEITQHISNSQTALIHKILSGVEIDFDHLLNLRLSRVDQLSTWITPTQYSSINKSLVRAAYTKLHNQIGNMVVVGPVMRSGESMANSIFYTLEGKIWAVFNGLSYLYPDAIKPNSALNFVVDKNACGYVELINVLRGILFNKRIIGSIIIPKIHTKLWDHQLDSVKKITSGFNKGVYGYGDASDVGSGKTLTALAITATLMANPDPVYSGALVLLPNKNLIDTWKTQIMEHTTGFDVIFQKRDEKLVIKSNTIVITTMPKNRDHMIEHNWLLVVIDECLTVQNRKALWTESAWIQSVMSKHLVMMSATFFRTKYDKLYYMLKMLRTGLPSCKEYLDVILSESIVSKISSTRRKWQTDFSYFKLPAKLMTEYQTIQSTEKNTEDKFSKLASYLISDSRVATVVLNQLRVLIDELAENGSRCLIYARARPEAEYWSQHLAIPIYPKKGQHCIVTLHEGTYGLNDLVIYDTIVMRPPAPDVVPQIKGRLDRPGQKSDNLNMHYFVLEDTIEMGLILRLNISAQFVQQYIMPLAKFYDVSVNFKKYVADSESAV